MWYVLLAIVVILATIAISKKMNPIIRDRQPRVLGSSQMTSTNSVSQNHANRPLREPVVNKSSIDYPLFFPACPIKECRNTQNNLVIRKLSDEKYHCTVCDYEFGTKIKIN